MGWVRRFGDLSREIHPEPSIVGFTMRHAEGLTASPGATWRRVQAPRRFNLGDYQAATEKIRRVDPKELSCLLHKANVVAISIGAGMSRGYVDTLPDLCQKLGLEPSAAVNTCLTDESVAKLLDLLSQDDTREDLFTVIGEFHASIYNRHIQPSTALGSYRALQDLVDRLQSSKKQVHIFSANLDGLEAEAGLCPVHPDHAKDIANTLGQNVGVVISLGQRQDHGAVISTLRLGGFQSYNVNLEAKPIVSWSGEQCRIWNHDGYVVCDAEEALTQL